MPDIGVKKKEIIVKKYISQLCILGIVFDLTLLCYSCASVPQTMS